MSKIRELRKEQNLTMKKLGENIGVAESTISLYETGKRQPDNETLKRIADFFNVSTDYLLGRETPAIDAQQSYPSESVTYMEIIGSVKAGYNGIAQEEHTGETALIPTAFLKGGKRNDFFVLRVSGSSMYPKLINGDLVLVKRTASVDSGALAVVLYGNEEATIKTVKYAKDTSWIDLVPTNPEYETKHIVGEDIANCRILGKIIKLIRDL